MRSFHSRDASRARRRAHRRSALGAAQPSTSPARSLYGFWTGLGPFTYNSVTYRRRLAPRGGGRAADLRPGGRAGDRQADRHPEFGAYARHSRDDRELSLSSAARRCWRSLISTQQTFALLSVEVDYRGVIDRIVHKEKADGSAVLEMSLESRFRDHQKGGYRVRSDADQRRIDANDDGLRHVTKAATEQVIFGRHGSGDDRGRQRLPCAKRKQVISATDLRMTRPEGWPERLLESDRARRARPFVWGESRLPDLRARLVARPCCPSSSATSCHRMTTSAAQHVRSKSSASTMSARRSLSRSTGDTAGMRAPRRSRHHPRRKRDHGRRVRRPLRRRQRQAGRLAHMCRARSSRRAFRVSL